LVPGPTNGANSGAYSAKATPPSCIACFASGKASRAIPYIVFTAFFPISFFNPPQTFNPSIIIPANFNIIVGYNIGFTTNINLNNAYIPPVSLYVSKLANGTLSYISTQAPDVQPNNSLIINISNIDNQYAQPTGSLYVINPTVTAGEIINEKPVNFIWCKLIPGTYNEITVSLLGTNLRGLKIQDPAMTFVFVIKDSNESIY